MNKILGIDWGEKKSGVAISDGLGITAKQLKSIKSSIKDFLELLKEESPTLLVFGLPRNMDGTISQQAEKVKKFTKELQKKTKIKIVFEDETNTSNLAKSKMIKEGVDPRKNKDLVDQKAAQIILEGYLNENKN